MELWTGTGGCRKDATVQTIRTLAGHQHIVVFLAPGQRNRIVTPERIVAGAAGKPVIARKGVVANPGRGNARCRCRPAADRPHRLPRGPDCPSAKALLPRIRAQGRGLPATGQWPPEQPVEKVFRQGIMVHRRSNYVEEAV